MSYCCVYCRTGQPGRFDDEHVVPQGFGRFHPDLVISDVCVPCNRYFGKELDWFLNRDSGEAITRSRLQPPLASKAGHLKSARIKMTINVPGPWMGARVYVCPDATTGRLRTELIPQLAFRRKGEENWVWFTVTELRATSTESLAKYRTETETRIIGPSERSCKYLRSMLTKLGVRFTEKGKLGDPITEGGGIRVYVEYTIDKTILRAIAKIAFNYFAYVHGADLALRGDFDSIRKFIRSGQEPPWKPVIPGRRRILAGETDMIRCTDGHLLVLEGDPRASSITARVALFNDITYVVRLCLRFSGVWRSFDAGHHFDITSREVTPLRAIPSYLLPMAPVHTTLPQPLLR